MVASLTGRGLEGGLADGRGSDGGWGVVEQIGYWRIVSTEEVTLRAGRAKCHFALLGVLSVRAGWLWDGSVRPLSLDWVGVAFGRVRLHFAACIATRWRQCSALLVRRSPHPRAQRTCQQPHCQRHRDASTSSRAKDLRQNNLRDFGMRLTGQQPEIGQLILTQVQMNAPPPGFSAAPLIDALARR